MPSSSPIAPESLVGTLDAGRALSIADASRQRDLDELTRRLSQLQSEADAAQREYQTAAAAPPAPLNPSDLFLTSLLGNLASVIGGNPLYAQQGAAYSDEMMRSNIQRRAENLRALHEISLHKAQAAEHAGDVLQAEKFRKEAETRARLADQIERDQQHREALNLERIRQQGRVDLENLDAQHALALEQARQRTRAAETSSEDLKALPTLNQYATLKTRLLSGINAVDANEAENRISQLKAATLTRLRTDKTPSHMVRRLDVFNEEVRRLKRKHPSAGFLRSGPGGQADTLSAAEVRDALYRAFSADSVDSFLQSISSRPRSSRGGGGTF